MLGLAPRAVIGLVMPCAAFGQGQTLSGTVLDSRGAPLQYAVVSVRGLNREARTDSVGVFTFVELRPGDLTLLVRRLGYQPRKVDLVIPLQIAVPLRVVLQDGVVELAAVDVGARSPQYMRYMAGFERRRKSGSGQFVTRAQIIARGPTRLSDMMRDVPGVEVSRSRTRGGNSIRFTGSSNFRRDCIPQYWVDGQLTRDAEIDDFPPGDVEGIELYTGPATIPLQFSPLGQTTTCGAVVIWTRPPG